MNIKLILTAMVGWRLHIHVTKVTICACSSCSISRFISCWERLGKCSSYRYFETDLVLYQVQRYKGAWLEAMPGIVQICAILCHYIASGDKLLPKFRDILSVPTSGIENQKFSLDSRTLSKGPISCPQPSVWNCEHSLRNDWEERSCHKKEMILLLHIGFRGWNRTATDCDCICVSGCSGSCKVTCLSNTAGTGQFLYLQNDTDWEMNWVAVH